MDAQGLYSDSFDFGGMPSGTTQVMSTPNPSSGGSLEGQSGNIGGPSVHWHASTIIILGIIALVFLHKTGIRCIAAD